MIEANGKYIQDTVLVLYFHYEIIPCLLHLKVLFIESLQNEWYLIEISINIDWKAFGERWVEGCVKEIELHIVWGMWETWEHGRIFGTVMHSLDFNKHTAQLSTNVPEIPN